MFCLLLFHNLVCTEQMFLINYPVQSVYDVVHETKRIIRCSVCYQKTSYIGSRPIDKILCFSRQSNKKNILIAHIFRKYVPNVQ
jgi:hypothetical protein